MALAVPASAEVRLQTTGAVLSGPPRVQVRVDLANLVHAASDEICRLAGIDEDSMLNLGLALREATVIEVADGASGRASIGSTVTIASTWCTSCSRCAACSNPR